MLVDDSKRNVTFWAMILIGAAALLFWLNAGWIWWAAIPLWCMAGVEILKSDHERINLIKVLVFGLLPFGALATSSGAPYLFGIAFWFWAVFIFVEREDWRQEMDINIAMPIVFGLMLVLLPQYASIFIALQYALFGIILLWKGEL